MEFELKAIDDLTNVELDWAIAAALDEDKFVEITKTTVAIRVDGKIPLCGWVVFKGPSYGTSLFSPTTDWCQGEYLIERFGIQVTPASPGYRPSAVINTLSYRGVINAYGRTMLEASMKALLKEKIGDFPVSIPTNGTTNNFLLDRHYSNEGIFSDLNIVALNTKSP